MIRHSGKKVRGNSSQLKQIIKFVITYLLNGNQYLEIVRLILSGLNWKKKKIFDVNNNNVEDLFDYKKNLNKKEKDDLYFLMYWEENRVYGLEKVLERYAGYSERICMSSEHGLFINKIPYWPIYAELPSIITFGEYRKEVLEKKRDIMVLKIGPYIHYAKEILSEKEIRETRGKLGKTLLVFVKHTVESTSYEKKNDFLDFIEQFKLKHEFDNVIISMYFVDIMKGEHEKYEKRGYHIFSAGHRNNSDFLDRLKTIFKLADFVLSEGIGTHVGYAIYMKVPVMIYKEEYLFKDTNTDYISNGINCWQSAVNKETTNRIIDAFLDYKDKITNEQEKICNYYFGNSEIKSPEELYECFIFAKKVYMRSIQNGKPFYINIKKELGRNDYSKNIYEMAKTNKYIRLEDLKR